MEIPIRLNLPDQDAVASLGQALENVIVTELGVRLRPGMATLNDFGTLAIDGMWHWDTQDAVVVVGGGAVYKITPGKLLLESGDDILLEDGSYMLGEDFYSPSTVTGGTALAVGTRPTFADFGTSLYIANGGIIQELFPSKDYVSHGGKNWSSKKNSYGVEPGVTSGFATYWNDLGAGSSYTAWSATRRYGSGTSDTLEDASAPQAVSFIVAADQYLLALESGSQRIHYSYPTEPWRWDGEWVSAESVPDYVNAIIWVNGDVLATGLRSAQTFQNDAVSPWISSNYGGIDTGVLAPYSLVSFNGSAIYIDNRKRLVTMSGRVAQSINKAFDTVLQRLAGVQDATGDVVVIDGVNFYILAVKQSSRTFAINLDNGSWSEWTLYSSGVASRYTGNCFCHAPTWGMLLVGDKTDGTVNYISSDLETDKGAAIRGIIRTPRLHTESTVVVPDVTLHLTKTAKTSSASNAALSVRWRNEGETWLNSRTVTLVDDAETDFTVHVRRCGSYRNSRQYEIDMTTSWPFTLMGANQA